MSFASVKAAILLEATGIEVGETRYIPCTECGGNSGVTRYPDKLLFGCFRCGARYVLDAHSRSLSHNTVARAKRLWNNDDLERYPITGEVLGILKFKYDLNPRDIRANGWFMSDCEHLHIMMPVLNHGGIEVAVQRKLLEDVPELNKNKLYRFTEEVRVAYDAGYFENLFADACVVVEDQISAARFGRLGIPAVCLLGTNLHYGEFLKIAADFDTCYVCLDPDAQEKAVTMTKRLGLLFKQAHRMVLPDDPKDVTDDIIVEGITQCISEKD